MTEKAIFTATKKDETKPWFEVYFGDANLAKDIKEDKQLKPSDKITREDGILLVKATPANLARFTSNQQLYTGFHKEALDFIKNAAEYNCFIRIE